MRFKSTIAAVLAVAATGFSGAGNAAVLPIEQILNLHMPHGHGHGLQHHWPAGEQHDDVLPAGLEVRNGGAWAHGRPLTNFPANHAVPFHVALVTAGQHPLQLDKPPGHSSAPSNVSAVPLPGALWLFGSAVVAFLGFSMRRKI